VEVAVTTVLAGNQLTAWDVFGDRRFLTGFKPSRRTASQAAGGPHRRRNLWQPQVEFIINLMDCICLSWICFRTDNKTALTCNRVSAVFA